MTWVHIYVMAINNDDGSCALFDREKCESDMKMTYIDMYVCMYRLPFDQKFYQCCK